MAKHSAAVQKAAITEARRIGFRRGLVAAAAIVRRAFRAGDRDAVWHGRVDLGQWGGAVADEILALEAAPADIRAICETLGFDPENHHNAAKCPYCSGPPGGQP